MSGLKLHQIRDVVAVADHGGLRAAARALGLAQPAITRSIREVEHYLGTALFERTSKGAFATPAGAAFLRRARSIQNDLAQAEDEVAQITGAEIGQVRVGLSTVPHLALLPRALPVFRSRYPKVGLTILEGLFSRACQALEEGSLDFYIGPLGEHKLSSSLVGELLFENDRVVFCRKGHPLSNAKSLAELADAAWISTSVTLDSEREMGPLFEAHGLPSPHVIAHAQSALTMVLAAANSDLLTMLPRQWLEFPSIGQLLHHIPLKERIAAPSIYLVHRRRLPLTPAAAFLQNLLCRAALNLKAPAASG